MLVGYAGGAYPSLKLGYDALSKLYDALGRRQTSVIRMEEKLVTDCSKQIAIDGHVIGCESALNDLAEKGYKFKKLGEAQVNLLMAYDVNTGIPLISRIYEGASSDKVSVRDFIDQVELRDMLFIVDRGFYSEDNINLFSSNGNAYIIPLGKNLNTCKAAVHSLEMHDRFMYQKGKKASVIEYKDEIIDGYRVITYRDLNESAAEQENYLRHIARGDNDPNAKHNNIRLGMNSRLDTLQAGILLAEFPTFRDEELEKVNHVASLYTSLLKNVPGLTIPTIPDGMFSSWAQYTIQLPDGTDRGAIQRKLKAEGIPTNIYCIKPMHLQGAFDGMRSSIADCPNTERLCASVLCQPIHPYLKDEEVEFICGKLKEVL